MTASRSRATSTTSAAGVQNLSLVKFIDRYLEQYGGGTVHTARAKLIDTRHFVDFLARHRGLSSTRDLRVRDWDFSSSQRFVDHALSRGDAPASVARRVATLKHLGRTMADVIAGFVNPVRELRGPRLPTTKPKALSRGEIAKVRRAATARISARPNFNRIRNETLLHFLLDTGLRADEVRLLKRGQVGDKLDWIENVRTKGRRYRNVYITTGMRAKLAEYLDLRRKKLDSLFSAVSHKLDRQLPLFISTYRARLDQPESLLMGPKTLWRAIHELSSGTPLHPHLLRHSFATDLLESSNDIRLVAQALGHSDVRVTMRYTERTAEQVANALEKSRRRSGRTVGRADSQRAGPRAERPKPRRKKISSRARPKSS